MSSLGSKHKFTDSPVLGLTEPERWTVPALEDFDPLAGAVLERRETKVGPWSKLARGALWLGRYLVIEPVRRWIERERTIRELSMLNERELTDLGITATEIPYIASRKIDPHAEQRLEIEPARPAAKSPGNDPEAKSPRNDNQSRPHAA